MSVAALVAAGLASAVTVGIARGFDPLALVILAVSAMLGALGVAVARRAGSGMVAPGRCEGCGGLVSPSAPYCKHCGEPLGTRAVDPGEGS